MLHWLQMCIISKWKNLTSALMSDLEGWASKRKIAYFYWCFMCKGSGKDLDHLLHFGSLRAYGRKFWDGLKYFWVMPGTRVMVEWRKDTRHGMLPDLHLCGSFAERKARELLKVLRWLFSELGNGLLSLFLLKVPLCTDDKVLFLKKSHLFVGSFGRLLVYRCVLPKIYRTCYVIKKYLYWNNWFDLYYIATYIDILIEVGCFGTSLSEFLKLDGIWLANFL